MKRLRGPCHSAPGEDLFPDFFADETRVRVLASPFFFPRMESLRPRKGIGLPGVPFPLRYSLAYHALVDFYDTQVAVLSAVRRLRFHGKDTRVFARRIFLEACR